MVKVAGLSHLGIQAHDPVALAGFYREVLGMAITGGSDASLGTSAFLSSRPEQEHHELAIFQAPKQAPAVGTHLAHIAFRVGTLDDLLASHRAIVARGIPIQSSANYGVALSFYFEDPEGHLVEVTWATGVACGTVFGDPVDLERPVGELLRDVARVAAEAGPPRAHRP